MKKRVTKALKILGGTILLGLILLYIVNYTINLKKAQLELVYETTIGGLPIPSITGMNQATNDFVVNFEQLTTNFADVKSYCLEEYGILLPDFDFDFENYNMVISYGRKITEIKYFQHSFNQPDYIKGARITFDEDYFNGHVFIYQMDKVYLEHAWVGNNHFYIMDGNKRVFVGHNLDEVNK